MVKMIIVFFVSWAVLSFAIQQTASMNTEQLWPLTKSIAYGLMTALITVLLLFVIVTLF